MEFGRVTFESSPSKGVNVLAIFRYVVKKIEVFSEGKIEKGIFCFRVCFRKINILVESWKSVEKEGKICVRTSQEEISWIFKKCLDNGNLWFLAFLFSVALRPHLFKTENQNFFLSADIFFQRMIHPFIFDANQRHLMMNIEKFLRIFHNSSATSRNKEILLFKIWSNNVTVANQYAESAIPH